MTFCFCSDASEPRCPDCAAPIGDRHHLGCAIARCLHTGTQRLAHPDDCRCPPDTWSGYWSGERECHGLNFHTPNGFPDLNRLYSEARWCVLHHRWEKPSC